ncbi:carbohydrate ABC transporter permease [Paenibacillus qinlingensis]|uniref:ABC-type glycerol-3-phosphate transport system permease component n=1 Tax=Paenibacillus qinlingensis TaxID=1837343 RepID=A0ABU1P536_9BACL|nr:carbohydrate ABC transporter permease [Paenibacillus qinlingensis]MDR6554868.1 ABC-type glycerol-3-phosphate transport system permease component [Paenibacillus qinlingensis]
MMANNAVLDTTVLNSKKAEGSTKNSVWGIVSTIILLLGAASMVLPFIWLILASLKTNAEFYNSFNWMPAKLQWSNYKELIFPKQGPTFLLYVFNTVKITVLSVVGMVISCSLVAFAIARIDFPGKNFIFGFAVISMFLPAQVTMIPQFIIFKDLGWIGTHLPLIVPSFFGGAFGIVLMRQYYRSISKEFDEAAKMDGAGWFAIYAKIHLPIVASPMITLAVLTFQEKWAELLYPMIFIGKNKDLWTMVLRIKDISTGQYNARPELEMAGDVLLVIPVILLFIFAQKYFTKSLTSSGVKG